MSQITSCPSCGTQFRVVADQLRISDGWVRCGRCQEVFDASQALQPLEQLQPAAEPKAQAPDLSSAHTATAAASASPAVPAAPWQDAPAPAGAAQPSVAQEASWRVAHNVFAPLSADADADADAVLPPATTPPPAVQGETAPEPEPDVGPLWPYGPLRSPRAPALNEPLNATSRAASPDVASSDAAPQLPPPPAPPQRGGASQVEPAALARGYELPSPPDADDEVDWAAQWLPAVPAAPSPAAAPVAAAMRHPDPLKNGAWAEAVHAAASTAAAAPLNSADVPRPPLPPPPPIGDALGAERPGAPPASPVDAPAMDAVQMSASVQREIDTQSDGDPSALPPPAAAWAAEALDAPAVPGFVRQAQRKAWWSQPVVRAAMIVGVVVLPMLLAAQVAVQERNTLAAWKPALRPMLEALCAPLNCQIGPRQWIAAMVVTGSSLHEAAQPHHYRVDVSILNQAGTPVAMPAVELTLLDTQGQIVVRKVLQAAEMGAPQALDAQTEWNGSLSVATQGLNLPVAGYRVLAFYP